MISINIAELIQCLPEYIRIIASGYIFVSVFDFIMYKKDIADYKHIFLKSIVYGFILKNILFTLTAPFCLSDWLQDLLLYLFSIVLAYLITLGLKSRKTSKIMKRLRIFRNHNNNVWLDIFDGVNPPWFDVSSTKLKTHYCGELDLLEDFERKPILILRKYKSFDENGNVIDDYSDDNNFKILIDTSLYDNIKIAYPETTPKKRFIKWTKRI